MKDTIVECMAFFGWRKDRIVDCFSKTVETAVAPSQASIWLTFDRECNRWWLRGGEFTSAGENVLAASYAIFPVGMSEEDIAKTIVEFVTQLDSQILGAWSVRLLDRRPVLCS